MSGKQLSASSQRFEVLDYLRGFFIFVIIIDHAYRWPSIFSVVTGQGALWVTAAEGFVIISGFLVGYIRGYKNRSEPVISVTKKLLSRAFILYVWFVISTLLYVTAAWYIPTAGSTPWVEIETFNWTELFISTATFVYSYTWVHFLYLYAIFLAISPFAVMLLRQKLPWFLGGMSLLGYILGLHFGIPWLQWQILFFIPSIAGFYLTDLRSFWSSLDRNRQKNYLTLLCSVTTLSLAGSLLAVFITPQHPASIWLNSVLFTKDPVGPGIVVLSFIWFAALIAVFQRGLPFLKKHLAWLLVPFGTRSLTAYILHGAAIIPLAFLFPMTDSVIPNTLLGGLAVIATWALIKIPLIQRVVPR